jgi:hypothetical protein
MIGRRARYSLAQLLELQAPSLVVVLLNKHGARATDQKVPVRPRKIA